MKSFVSLSILLLLLLTAGCVKKRNKSVTVVRDCTGTYLRFEGKDYQVCNLEKVAAHIDGESITATFHELGECNGSAKSVITCTMLHANEGWIEVDKVK